MPADDSLLGQNLVDERNEEVPVWLSSSPLHGVIDLNADYRKAQEEGHHVDCDGFGVGLERCDGRCKNWDSDAIAFCTQDDQCGAEADQHLEGCPVEERLREEMGF